MVGQARRGEGRGGEGGRGGEQFWLALHCFDRQYILHASRTIVAESESFERQVQ